MSTALLEQIYESRQVLDKNGHAEKLHSEVTPDEGRFLRSLVESNRISRTLEIGCAFGISSLHICEALSRSPSPSHTIIDPGQNDYWKGIGIHNLDRAGFDFYELIEEASEFALPRLVQENRRFQLALIDGWHTFDHVLLDFFYVDQLLEDGGIVVLDDLQLPGIRKTARYISNYPNYRVLGGARQSVLRPSLKRRLVNGFFHAIAKVLPRSYVLQVFDISLFRSDYEVGLTSEMIAFQKTGPDKRDSHWFEPF